MTLPEVTVVLVLGFFCLLAFMAWLEDKDE